MTLTGIVVTACFIALGIFDLVMVIKSGVGCSISRFLQRSALKAPLVAVSIGFVLGHLFGYMAPECPPCEDKAEHTEDLREGRGGL